MHWFASRCRVKTEAIIMQMRRALHAMMDGRAIILPLFALMRTKSGAGEKTALLIDGELSAHIKQHHKIYPLPLCSVFSGFWFLGVRGGQVRTRAT